MQLVHNVLAIASKKVKSIENATGLKFCTLETLHYCASSVFCGSYLKVAINDGPILFHANDS